MTRTADFVTVIHSGDRVVATYYKGDRVLAETRQHITEFDTRSGASWVHDREWRQKAIDNLVKYHYPVKAVEQMAQWPCKEIPPWPCRVDSQEWRAGLTPA